MRASGKDFKIAFNKSFDLRLNASFDSKVKLKLWTLKVLSVRSHFNSYKMLQHQNSDSLLDRYFKAPDSNLNLYQKFSGWDISCRKSRLVIKNDIKQYNKIGDGPTIEPWQKWLLKSLTNKIIEKQNETILFISW